MGVGVGWGWRRLATKKVGWLVQRHRCVISRQRDDGKEEKQGSSWPCLFLVVVSSGVLEMCHKCPELRSNLAPLMKA